MQIKPGGIEVSPSRLATFMKAADNSLSVTGPLRAESIDQAVDYIISHRDGTLKELQAMSNGQMNLAERFGRFSRDRRQYSKHGRHLLHLMSGIEDVSDAPPADQVSYLKAAVGVGDFTYGLSTRFTLPFKLTPDLARHYAAEAQQSDGKAIDAYRRLVATYPGADLAGIEMAATHDEVSELDVSDKAKADLKDGWRYYDYVSTRWDYVYYKRLGRQALGYVNELTALPVEQRV